jgi:hypothetical protein
MDKYQVRFNLGKGENFMKWKVSDSNGNSKYYSPDEVCLYMKECRLVNHKSTANKIYNGSNKAVCAWIECSEIKIDSVILRSSSKKICYNPKVSPNWTLSGSNVDKEKFKELFTVSNSVRLSAA